MSVKVSVFEVVGSSEQVQAQLQEGVDALNAKNITSIAVSGAHPRYIVLISYMS